VFYQLTLGIFSLGIGDLLCFPYRVNKKHAVTRSASLSSSSAPSPDDPVRFLPLIEPHFYDLGSPRGSERHLARYPEICTSHHIEIAISLAQACASATLGHLSPFGTEIILVKASLITNFSDSIPAVYWAPQPIDIKFHKQWLRPKVKTSLPPLNPNTTPNPRHRPRQLLLHRPNQLPHRSSAHPLRRRPHPAWRPTPFNSIEAFSAPELALSFSTLVPTINDCISKCDSTNYPTGPLREHGTVRGEYPPSRVCGEVETGS